MPRGSTTTLVDLGALLLKRLQESADLEKINSIVSSELIISYGLDISEELSMKISKDVYRWYHA